MLVAGVDEAGRGPLAGPVVAAAVVLDPDRRVRGLRDSKLLTPDAREELAVEIRTHAVAWAVGVGEVAEIDAINIFQASLLAMRRAVEALAVPPDVVWIDGQHCPPLAYPARAIVDGDRSVAAIAAASILAKTARDARMCALDAEFPGYGFAQHKGYPVDAHIRALDRLGACPIHRRSFAPVRSCLGLPPLPPWPDVPPEIDVG